MISVSFRGTDHLRFHKPWQTHQNAKKAFEL